MLADSKVFDSVFETIGVGGLALLLAGIGIAALSKTIVAWAKGKNKPKYSDSIRYATGGQIIESVANYNAVTSNKIDQLSKLIVEGNEQTEECLKEIKEMQSRQHDAINELRVELARARRN